MHHVARLKGQRKMINWRCSCGKPQSMFDGTIFGNREKPFYDMMQFIKCWSIVITLSKAIQMLQFDNINACRQTLGDFYSSLRNVCMIASSQADKTDHLKEYTHFNISRSNNEVFVSKFISLASFLNASGKLNKNSYFIITIKYNID